MRARQDISIYDIPNMTHVISRLYAFPHIQTEPYGKQIENRFTNHQLPLQASLRKIIEPRIERLGGSFCSTI
jgi:predicted membrane chloride channel (bestrophin family)